MTLERSIYVNVARALAEAGQEVGLALRYLDVLRRRRVLKRFARRAALATDRPLADHPNPRYARIPAMRARLRQERDELEGRLREWIRMHDTRTFAAAVDARPLSAAVAAAETARRPCVVLAYQPRERTAGGVCGGGLLRFHGAELPTLWGHGAGMACVATADLRSLVGPHPPPPNQTVSIDCDLHCWEGRRDAVAVVVQNAVNLRPPASPRRFAYYVAATVVW